MSSQSLTGSERRGGPIDTNLLVLLAVGTVDENFVEQHKRTREYSADDYHLLCEFVAGHQIIVTPNILTEASNLLSWRPRKDDARFMLVLQQFITVFEERYLASRTASRQAEFTRLGLTDATIIACAREVSGTITDDLDLYLALNGAGCLVVNFTHLRVAHGLL